ncbi:MAG TPA: glycosyltransferase family 39 protein [Pyrinomonadaceae bacterium]|nr:glycosyltransferase family 39 protein [Pyrinomonadaceae bacterium]
MDYTMLSLSGYPSSMALGRNLFIFGNHTLFIVAKALFNLQPDKAYLLFKYAVVAQAPFAIVACWWLAYAVSHSLPAATISSLLIVCSPVFVLYGGQVMTDVPSVLILAVALGIHFRGIQRKNVWLILLGAGLMGLGMNLRETIGFYAPWLIIAPFACRWKFGRREVFYVAASCVIFVLLGFSWFAFWFVTDPYYRHIWYGWRQSMAEESSRHPVALINLRPFLLYLFITAPVVFITLPFAAFSEWRRRGLSSMMCLWLVGAFADALLFFNYSTSVNWRYFLTGLPGLAPLAANWLLLFGAHFLGNIQRAFLAVLLVIAAFALSFSLLMRPVSFEFIQRRAMSKDYQQRLKDLPPDAVMISGAQTIAVTYWAAIGAGHWQTIGTGGGWPGDRLFDVINDHLAKGKRVFIDSDPRWWLPCGWQRDEIPLITALEDHFRFRRASDLIYELRPMNDTSANDKPNLKRLLPENRPEDTKKCPSGRI